MRSNGRHTRIAGALTSLFLLATACAPASSQSSVCPASTNGIEDRIQLPQLERALSLNAARPLVPTGQQLVAVIKDGCTTLGPISRLIGNRFEGTTPSGVRSYEFRSPGSYSRKELEDVLADDPCIAMISEAGETATASQTAIPAESDDPRTDQQHHLTTLGFEDALEIFYHPQTGIKNEVIIAIIDGGVRLDHEDLKGNLWVNRGEIPNNGIDDDGNGYIDDVNGYNMASHKPSPEPEKTQANSSWQWAHGTKVAGLAAAVSKNGVGISGVAGRAKIMAINAMGADTTFSQADTANSIRYAVDNGARVINLSLGGSKASADYQSALRYAISKGAIVLAAAGNENMSIGQSYSAAGLAASYSGLVSIGNFKTSDYLKSPTSNFNPAFVELGAPGTSTSSIGLLTTSPTTASSYATFSGTSAATPIAAGAAALTIALIESRGYKASPSEVEALLKKSAKKVKGLESYFKDGNALDLISLAKLTDYNFPASGRRPASSSLTDTATCSLP